MSVAQAIELAGIVKWVRPGTTFRVTLDNEHKVMAHFSGKMRITTDCARAL
jgi:translation initiation factor IF-1